MLVQVLGPTRVWRGGVEIDLGPRRRRAVLGLLVLARGKPVQRGELVGTLWGDRPPPSATNIIQTHVKHLRRLLDPDRPAWSPSGWLPTVDDGYALRIPADQVDMERFRGLVSAADDARRRGDRERVAGLLGEALRLWCGPPLADVPILAGHSQVLALIGERRDALLAYGEEMIVIGKPAEVLPVITKAAAAHPLDEAVQVLLLRAYAAAGQRAMAFAVFDKARRALADELGVEPSPGLAEAYTTLLREPATHTGVVLAVKCAVAGTAQLPVDITGFIGRAAELAMLDRLLAAAGGICVLCGAAGVGKTALAVHWARRSRNLFPDGQLYVDLRGYDQDSPMPPSQALTWLLETLGVAARDIPIDVAARADRYRSVLSGRRMLIVLDNASAVEQVRLLLPGTPGCFVLVTSRGRLAGLAALDEVERLELDLLPAGDATALLRRLIGERVRTEPAAAAVFVEQCARLPLALRVGAELVVSRPATALMDLVDELADRQRRLLVGGDDLCAVVRVVFSWSYRQLPDAAARLFRALGTCPGPSVDLPAVAVLGQLNLDTASQLVAVLARAYLVQPDLSGRFGMHDLLRAYAAELAATNDSDADRAAAMSRLLDYYLAVAAIAMDVLYPTERRQRPSVAVQATPLALATDPARLRAWLNVERANLAAVCAYAAERGWSSHAIRLAAMLNGYLECAATPTG